jgi:hypothetical protein
MLITDRCVKPLQFIIQWPLNFYYERLLEFPDTVNGMLANVNDSETCLSYFSCAFFSYAYVLLPSVRKSH